MNALNNNLEVAEAKIIEIEMGSSFADRRKKIGRIDFRTYFIRLNIHAFNSYQ
jgi:hypothetical protein